MFFIEIRQYISKNGFLYKESDSRLNHVFIGEVHREVN